MNRRSFLLAGLALAAGSAAPWAARPAWAHHGWGWASEEEFELSGPIKAVRLGNPHGEMTVGAADGDWLVEIGQPWRNERVGLSPALLAEGTFVTVHGHRAADRSQRLMKAERLIIAGRSYNLYPDRAS